MKRIWKWLTLPIILGLLLFLILITVLYETLSSVVAILDSQTQPAGYNLPSFVTDEMMEAFLKPRMNTVYLSAPE